MTPIVPPRPGLPELLERVMQPVAEPAAEGELRAFIQSWARDLRAAGFSDGSTSGEIMRDVWPLLCQLRRKRADAADRSERISRQVVASIAEAAGPVG